MSSMLTVIGLMSGTSLDGVDAAAIRTDGETIQAIGPSISLPYSPQLRARARALLDRATGPLDIDGAELCAVERAITDQHTEAVQTLRAQVHDAELIGFHGQTILHAPDVKRTWQIGDASRLSQATGLPVVHDFRSADVAYGGEGAPLVPWYHAALLHDMVDPVAVLNIGGVANVTFIGADRSLMACDTGPGNALLDDWAFAHTGIACDVDGRLARAGTVQPQLLERLLSDPYFARQPPKSLDRQSFAAALEAIAGCSPEDGAATLAAFTVQAICRTALPDRPAAWYVCGGGRHNPVIMEGLKQTLGVPVQSVDLLGWDGDMLEAQCFGFLAMRVLRRLPLSAPTITGAKGLFTGGRLTCSGLTPIPDWIFSTR